MGECSPEGGMRRDALTIRCRQVSEAGSIPGVGAALEVLLAGLEDLTGGATAVVAGLAQDRDVTEDGGLGPAARAPRAAEHRVMLTARLASCVEDVRAYRAAVGHLTDHRGGSAR